MDASKVREFALSHLDRMRSEFKLNFWHIDLCIGRLPEGRKAECAYKYQYEWARITIDPDQADGEEDILRSIRHELLHLIHADFHQYLQQAEEFVDERTAEAIAVAFDAAAEKTVLKLERMLDLGLCWPLKPEDDE